VLRRQFVTGILMTVVLTVLLGLIYPLLVTGISEALMSKRADGSFLKVNGKIVGSSLIGQNFADDKGNPLPQYFQPRPSSAGENGYNGMASAGSNLGPSNPDLLDAVKKRADDYRTFNGLSPGTKVPVDAVTSSSSGLDPAISTANADMQAQRVARARDLDVKTVTNLIRAHTQDRQLGFLGEQTVNVLNLNLALDRLVH
jgi:K+-transporting ATPase ATPase C chain